MSKNINCKACPQDSCKCKNCFHEPVCESKKENFCNLMEKWNLSGGQDFITVNLNCKFFSPNTTPTYR